MNEDEKTVGIKEEQNYKPSINSHNKREIKQVTKNSDHNEDTTTVDECQSNSSSNNKHPLSGNKKKFIINKRKSKSLKKDDAIDLSKRRDVINKGILRSVRRFLTNKFKEFAQSKFESKDHRATWYYDTIKEFTSANFTEDKPMMSELQYHLACIIFPKLLLQSGEFQSTKCADDINEYYNCIYKYSHTRLVSLLQLEPIKLIYYNFYKEAVEHESQYEPIKDMKECAKAGYDEFYEVFKGKRDIDELVSM